MNFKKLCIYHGNCADGFGAAWSVRHALGEDNVEFYAGTYNDPPPDVTGREVIMVDFSYKRPVLLGMAVVAKSILILDHHKSAEAELVDLPDNVEAYFDMNRSGAMLAWDYYNPDITAPDLLHYIQDRDLWQFRLPHSREVSAGLFSHPYDFELWDTFAFKTGAITKLISDGSAIERKHFKDINEFIKVAARRMMIAGYSVPTLNAPYFWSSDAGDILGKDVMFAACYWDTPEGRVFSLRSDENGLDVSKIAALFGGGGHKHAAGFRLGFHELDKLVVRST